MLAAVIARGLHHHGRHTSRRFAFRGRSLAWQDIPKRKKVWGICQTAVHCKLGARSSLLACACSGCALVSIGHAREISIMTDYGSRSGMEGQRKQCLESRHTLRFRAGGRVSNSSSEDRACMTSARIMVYYCVYTYTQEDFGGFAIACQ